MPEDAPAAWCISFEVNDIDAPLKQIAKLGGSVIPSAEDTPYGRLAQAADPTGTLFKLIASS